MAVVGRRGSRGSGEEGVRGWATAVAGRQESRGSGEQPRWDDGVEEEPS